MTEDFATLVGHWNPSGAKVDILDPAEWDSNGNYEEIIKAVRKASQGADVRVYKISKDQTRAEYFVVSSEGTGKGARLVGVKALAVES